MKTIRILKRVLLSLFCLYPALTFAQHLSVAQLLELVSLSTDRRRTVLQANSFAFRSKLNITGTTTTCYRYGRTQADLYNQEYEEWVNYCTSGSLTYATYSPEHATNLKFQLVRKFDFRDQGAVTGGSGLLKNLYQRRNLKVETANIKDSQQQDMWVFQFYEENATSIPEQPAIAQKTESIPESIKPSGKVALKGNFYALIIGVNDYVDRRLPDLAFPIQDGLQLKRVLVDQYTFDERHVTTLSNPTRKTILRTFDDLTYKLKKDDNLLIFFAGHGRQEEKSQQGYWLPTDAENDYNDDWLSNSTIRDQLRRFICQHVLVISDACFSGELISTRSGTQPSVAIQQLYNLRSRRAITSSGNTVVPDRSVFINYLVQRLAENTKSYLTASELFINMREAVINNSSLKQVPMYGYVQQAGDEGGDFIFIRR